MDDPSCPSHELISVGRSGTVRLVKDPFCGRVVEKEKAVVKMGRDGSRCYFCSRLCLAAYCADPRRILRH